MSEGREDVDITAFEGNIVISLSIAGRSAGIRTRGLLDPKIRLESQGVLSAPFGAVYSGRNCFPITSAPMPPSAPHTVWVAVWVTHPNTQAPHTQQRHNTGTNSF